jgi:HlyD family secretion protein
MNETPLYKQKVSWINVLAIAILTLVVSSAVTGMVYQYLSTKEPIAKKIESREREEIPSVAAKGRIEPEGEIVKVSSSIEGAKVEELLVKLGDVVTKGQNLAILDTRDRLQASLKTAQSQVKVAIARLEQVRAGAKLGAINARSANIDRLKAELQGQIETQQATIDRWRAELNNATTECDRYQKLHLQGAISTSIKDNICLKKSVVQKELELSIANKKMTVNTLIEELSREKATLNEVAEVRPVDIAFASAEIEAAKANLLQAESNLKLAYIKAPKNGRILKVNTFPGEVIGDSSLLDLGQTEQMYAIAEVYETDISRINLGQKAIITSLGFLDKLSGIVYEIGWQIGKKDVLGTDPAADVDARVVEVKIRLDARSSQQVKNLTNLEVNIIIESNH